LGLQLDGTTSILGQRLPLSPDLAPKVEEAREAAEEAEEEVPHGI